MTREAKTAAVQRWLGQQRPGELKISDWVVTEFSSALSIKLRERQIDSFQRADALAAFAHMTASSVEIFPVLSSHFRIAARFVENHSLGMRSGDALHLAIAADHGAALFSLDKRQSGAAMVLGVRAFSL